MNKKTIALLLNAFVLPGLGQLYLGRKVVGGVVLVVVNLLLLITLFIVLKGLSPVIAAKALSGPLQIGDAVVALEGISTAGKVLLALFAAVWAFALADLFRHRQEP